jgi:hypothetical protein
LSSVLRDGIVIPNFLSVTDSSESVEGWNRQFTDYSLRVGRVIQAYSGGSGRNINKDILYDVEIVHSDGDGGFAPLIFSKCQVASLFGGIADYIKWTPRIANFNPDTQIGLGSRVLLLCTNANRTSAYIIGGIPHPEDKTVETFSNNHHFKAEFNGVNFNVNNDGDLVIQHRGATKEDGSIISTTGSNTFLSFDKEGFITFGVMDKDVNNHPTLDPEKPFFELDKNQAQVTLAAKNGFTLNGNKEAFLQSTTYRQQQQQMHSTVMNLLSSLSQLLQTVSLALITAGIAHQTPITGPVIGSGQIVTAGHTINEAASVVTQIQSAINSFEQQADSYLSKIHFHEDDLNV